MYTLPAGKWVGFVPPIAFFYKTCRTDNQQGPDHHLFRPTPWKIMLAATRRYFVVIGLTLEVDVENKQEHVDDVIRTRLMSRDPNKQ